MSSRGYAVIVAVVVLIGSGAGAWIQLPQDAQVETSDHTQASQGGEHQPSLDERLEPSTERILISKDGRRMSEFTVDASPTDPDHLVLGAMDWDHPGGDVACVSYVSRDGGRTWSASEDVPGLGRARANADPWVTVDPSGTAHLACMDYVNDTSEDNPIVVLKHARSEDGGETWSTAQPFPRVEPTSNVDKDAIEALPNGDLIACAYQAGALTTWLSTDGGKTWEDPVQHEDVVGSCNGFAVGSDGTVHLAYLQFDSLVTGTLTSHDGGRTWEDPVPAARSSRAADDFRVDIALRSTVIPTVTMETVATDPSTGTVYVATQAWDDDADRWTYHLNRSLDQGETYEALDLLEIPSTDCGDCHVLYPTVAVDDDGRLGVQLMLTDSMGLHRETWLAVSPDQGEAWLDPVKVAETNATGSAYHPQTWSGHATAAAENGIATARDGDRAYTTNEIARLQRNDHMKWGGDYWDLTATEEGFLTTWIDHQNGYPQIWGRVVGLHAPASPSDEAAGRTG